MGDLAALDDDNPAADRPAPSRQAKRAADLAERVYGGGHPELARLLCILAVLQGQKGIYDAAASRPDDAKKDYDDAIQNLGRRTEDPPGRAPAPPPTPTWPPPGRSTPRCCGR